MKAACLIPYCPLPCDSGARSIFEKHLSFLQRLGSCSILSAKSRPVGYGWTSQAIENLINQGFALSFVNSKLLIRVPQIYGILYAAFFKFFRQEKAFGHSNPYHRYAFDSDWLNAVTKGYDICEIHYSYWARLETACPKVVVVHDLWSDIMWEGTKKETIELGSADLLVTVSYDDMLKLQMRGLNNVHWSPPCIEESYLDDSREICIVGSGNRHNIEGLQWLLKNLKKRLPSKIHIYGAVGDTVLDDDRFVRYGPYPDPVDPFRQCGIVLMLTKEGTGLQIKAVEALAAGRAVVARKGAMRGLPRDEIGWVEAESAEELVEVAFSLRFDDKRRRELVERGRAYYHRYLNKEHILKELEENYHMLFA